MKETVKTCLIYNENYTRKLKRKYKNIPALLYSNKAPSKSGFHLNKEVFILRQKIKSHRVKTGQQCKRTQHLLTMIMSNAMDTAVHTGAANNINSIHKYHQTSNISCTFVANKIVDHSDVVGTSPAGAAPTTFHSQLNTWLQLIVQRQLQDKTRNI